MANNRTFFKNVRAGRMSFRDIFSDVTKKHTPEENARVLIAGTPLTTPGEAEMLAGWQKPFLFSRFFLMAAVLCALGFYACSKTYSFFTGANHLHSIISPGVPGRILSAGLILPLNVAVGFVVCCTMYSFYMYFHRGEL